MTPELNRAWVAQAQADAERGVIECRVCRSKAPFHDTITTWTDGVLVFAICRACSAAHDVITRPTERGLEVRAVRRAPLIVGGGR